MLKLPHLSPDQLSRAANDKDPDAHHPLRHCLHLYKELDDDLADFESVRRQKVQQSNERNRDTTDTKLPKVSPRRGKASSRLSLSISSKGSNDKEEQASSPADLLEPKRENLSGVGNWLDCRAFTKNDNTFLGIARQQKQADGNRYNMTSLSAGQRFVLRKCKDALLNRYGSLQNAFAKLDVNLNKGLSMTEFCASSSRLFKEHEARVLYMYLDQNHDQCVTMTELCSLLEVC